MLAARDATIFHLYGFVNSAFEKIACLLVQFHEERNERLALLVFFFFFFATGAKIDLRADLGSMIEERSVDRFIAKDYFFFLFVKLKQFRIPRFEFDFHITMEH